MCCGVNIPRQLLHIDLVVGNVRLDAVLEPPADIGDCCNKLNLLKPPECKERS